LRGDASTIRAAQQQRCRTNKDGSKVMVGGAAGGMTLRMVTRGGSTEGVRGAEMEAALRLLLCW
jgi:hypothetical protein